MGYILSFIVVFSVSFLLIPGMSRLATKLGFVDVPTERKKHDGPVPLLGGAGIFIAFLTGYLVFIRPVDTRFFGILAASSLILAVGIIDDFYKTKGREFGVLPRLAVQMAAAVIVYFSGIVFSGFTNPLNGQYVSMPTWMQFILSITWIMGVTNVINWSDGVDGLAGSLTVISGTTLFVVALAKNQPYSAMMSILIVGATLGFLRYNRHPAQIFMGDSGANFLGFILAVVALDGAFKQTTVISLFIPILALGVPIFDNLFVVFRRSIEGKPIYKADATQIHHRLLSSGLNPRQVVAFISLVSVCFSLLSIIILLLKV